jgi:anti-sigma regulatory factor (Ser/Thr protein kinase)
MPAPTHTAPDVTPAPSGLLSGVHGPIDRFCLENDPALVGPLLTQFHDRLRTVGACGEQAAARVVIALEEALLNAIYHGNLELSSDLKESGDGRFEALARERRWLAPYAARRVRVAAGITPARATFVVQDEGPGFDVSKVPDPTAPEFLERPSGRGILLMRALMDDVRYNATGTRCTLSISRKS